MNHKRFLFAFTGIFLSFSVFFISLPRVLAQAQPGEIMGVGLIEGVSPSGWGTPSTASKVFTLQYTPDTPAAYDKVTVTAVSYEVNMNTVPIAWILNGKTQQTGIGLKTFTFSMDSRGVPQNLRVEAQTKDYGVVFQEITFTPAGVDTLWQADTYTPPFYKGKTLPTSQSKIKVVAFPDFSLQGKTVNANALIYNWSKGYFVDTKNSGLGKNVFIYIGGYAGNSDSVTTSITTQDGTISAKKITNIEISTPKIVFYQNKALEGVRFESQLGNTFKIAESEATLRAEPFFFSFSSRNASNGEFAWNIDGRSLNSNPDNKSEYIVQAPDKGSGKVTLSLSIKNKDRYIQTATKKISLTYTNP